jgi:hypothetical protein
MTAQGEYVKLASPKLEEDLVPPRLTAHEVTVEPHDATERFQVLSKGLDEITVLVGVAQEDGQDRLHMRARS